MKPKGDDMDIFDDVMKYEIVEETDEHVVLRVRGTDITRQFTMPEYIGFLRNYLSGMGKTHHDFYGRYIRDLTDIALTDPEIILKVAREQEWEVGLYCDGIEMDITKHVNPNEEVSISIIPPLTDDGFRENFKDYLDIGEGSVSIGCYRDKKTLHVTDIPEDTAMEVLRLLDKFTGSALKYLRESPSYQ